jgi:hypothetical protein
MKSNDIEIWLDLLCFETFIKVLFFKKNNFVNVYYFNLSLLFSPFFVMLQNVKSIKFQQVDDFSQSEQKVGNISAFEFIRGQVVDKLSEISQRWIKSKHASILINKCNYNTEKVRKYLELKSIYYFLRILEMKVVLGVRSKSVNRIILIRNSPFSEAVKNEIGFNAKFYRSYISHYFPIITRKNNYGTDRFHFLSLKRINTVYQLILFWLKYVYVVIYNEKNNSSNDLRSVNSFGLGGEILQPRVRMDEINDLFWLKSDSIDPGAVSVITPDLDDESKKTIKDLGVQRIINDMDTKRLKYYFIQFISKSSFQIFRILYWKSTVNIYDPINMIYKVLFRWNEVSWIQFHIWMYYYSVFFAEKYFINNNIRILFANHCGSAPLVKSQALENIGGFYVSYHWNVQYAYANFPTVDPKCADIFFLWGSYFADGILKKHKYLGVFPIGFPTDYYFNDYKIAAHKLRAEYPGKFIISYHDNTYGDDIPYSLNLQLDIHKMLISILRQFPHVILFLKPKRKPFYEKLALQLPELNEWEKSGRMRLFFGDTVRTKAVPALVGMASDLVIGIGISSAAAECSFAGTLTYHADLAARVRHEFVIKGLNKVVFRDIGNLRFEIEDCIENGTQGKYEAYREIYRMLDPFMDGQAYQRVGFILRTLQEQLENGLSREKAVEATKYRYDEYLQEKGYFDSLYDSQTKQPVWK